MPIVFRDRSDRFAGIIVDMPAIGPSYVFVNEIGRSEFLAFVRRRGIRYTKEDILMWNRDTRQVVAVNPRTTFIESSWAGWYEVVFVDEGLIPSISDGTITENDIPNLYQFSRQQEFV